MVKNLLILKNELMTLEIGDVRSGGLAAAGVQHFTQIWDTLRPAQNLLGGLLSSFGSLSTYIPMSARIPGSSLWSRSGASTPVPGASAGWGGPGAGAGAGAAGGEVQDATEQLDELLRQSIYGFTRRWAGVLNEARGVVGKNKLGGKNLAKVEKELDEMLERAFSGQPEVVGKLKEAIQIEAEAQVQALGEKKSIVTRV